MFSELYSKAMIDCSLEVKYNSMFIYPYGCGDLYVVFLRFKLRKIVIIKIHCIYVLTQICNSLNFNLIIINENVFKKKLVIV